MCLFTDEGEYICSVCTVFGLERDEIQVLIENGMKCTDHNKESEGYEVQNSAFRVTLQTHYSTNWLLQYDQKRHNQISQDKTIRQQAVAVECVTMQRFYSIEMCFLLRSAAVSN